MSEGNFTESVVEDAALAWVESLGYTVKIYRLAGETLTLSLYQKEIDDYAEVLFGQWLREELMRLNRTLPAESLRITKPVGFKSSGEETDNAVHFPQVPLSSRDEVH